MCRTVSRGGLPSNQRVYKCPRSLVVIGTNCSPLGIGLLADASSTRLLRGQEARLGQKVKIACPFLSAAKYSRFSFFSSCPRKFAVKSCNVRPATGWLSDHWFYNKILSNIISSCKFCSWLGVWFWVLIACKPNFFLVDVLSGATLLFFSSLFWESHYPEVQELMILNWQKESWAVAAVHALWTVFECRVTHTFLRVSLHMGVLFWNFEISQPVMRIPFLRGVRALCAKRMTICILRRHWRSRASTHTHFDFFCMLERFLLKHSSCTKHVLVTFLLPKMFTGITLSSRSQS